MRKFKQLILHCVVPRFFFKEKIKKDSFDDKFGFILKYKLDSESNYNKVKTYYLDHL